MLYNWIKLNWISVLFGVPTIFGTSLKTSSLKQELAPPSIQAHIRHCYLVWTYPQTALLHSSSKMQRQADQRHSPGPISSPRAKMNALLLKTLLLRVESKKNVPSFHWLSLRMSQFSIPWAVFLKLPTASSIHLTIHAPQIKPVSVSPLGHHPQRSSGHSYLALLGQDPAPAWHEAPVFKMKTKTKSVLPLGLHSGSTSLSRLTAFAGN